jgi:colanic acid biosynthesis glycosyl transferase WcaI
MKLLVYGLNFSPELIGIGKYTGEMARWFARRGHEVRVVTAYPYYPQWRVAAPYRGVGWRRERIDGITLYRCPLWVPQRPGAARRIVHLLSYALSSAPVALWQGATWRPDAVIGVEPTLLAAPAAAMAAWLGGSLSWLHIQDFEVEAAFGVGLLEGDGLRRLGVGLEGAVLRAFDRVSTISPAMAEGVRRKGVPAERVRLLPNWAAIDEIYPTAEPSPLRRELRLPAGVAVALYAGNMSEKQGLECLVETARRLRFAPHIRFVFAGEGAARARLEAMSAELDNVHFLPLQPPERLNDLLNLADIHLLPQRRGVADLVMPSKLLGMLASARPVVAGADPEAAVARAVAGCGVVVPPEEGAAMAEAVLALAADPARRAALGLAGRQRVIAEWSRDAVLAKLERWIEELRPPERQRAKRSALWKAEAPHE